MLTVAQRIPIPWTEIMILNGEDNNYKYWTEQNYEEKWVIWWVLNEQRMRTGGCPQPKDQFDFFKFIIINVIRKASKIKYWRENS